LTACELPFEQYDYFHLKPILNKGGHAHDVVDDPHVSPPYGLLKSYLKLLFFILQYNVGWYKNIRRLKQEKSLVIFDRYYDDLFVDHKRYRYGGSKKIAKFIRHFIYRPDLYFVLTAEAEIIHRRKQEVVFEELERQIEDYRNLVDNKRYIAIDVDGIPEQIVKKISTYLIKHINERS